MKKEEKVQIIEDFLIEIGKTYEMEKNNSIPSVISQYKFKKEELFDDFTLILIQLIPNKNLNNSLIHKSCSFIHTQMLKYNVYQEYNLEIYFKKLFNKALIQDFLTLSYLIKFSHFLMKSHEILYGYNDKNYESNDLVSDFQELF